MKNLDDIAKEHGIDNIDLAMSNTISRGLSDGSGR